MVHVLIAGHIAHWLIMGRTLAPLELNEVLYTLELGIITAGFIFMSLAVIATAIFGRFFCSWGCHLLALQDLSAWLLAKVGIRPKPVRSRVLLLVPLGAMIYMFLWPHVMSVIEGRGLPIIERLHVQGENQAWASFITDDFWRNLPGPGVTVATFFICGFAVVYLLGSRSFCTYACPYGAIFAIVDRAAPGRIKLASTGTECTQCGLCTAACSSHIRVHQELTVFGRVVSPACLKDLDCVSACPTGAITYGRTRPSGLRSWRRFGRFGVPYDFTWREDALMAIVFIGSLMALRGLYGLVPFLLSLAAAGGIAFLAAVAVRLITRRDVRLLGSQLKRAGQLLGRGWSVGALLLMLALFVAHSGFIRWHDFLGQRAFGTLMHRASLGESIGNAQETSEASRHLELCDRWGLLRPSELSWRLASLHWASGAPFAAEPHIQRLVDAHPTTHEWRLKLAAIAMARSDLQRAAREAQTVIDLVGGSAAPHDRSVVSLAHTMLEDIKLLSAAPE